MRPTSCWRATGPIRPLKQRSSRLPPPRDFDSTRQKAPSIEPSQSRTPPRSVPRSRFAEPTASPGTGIASLGPGRKFALYMSMFTVFGIAAYSTNLYVTYKRHIPLSESDETGSTAVLPGSSKSQRDVSSRYNTIAPIYDDEVDTQEWLMGMKAKRKKLVDQARGHVLEVSVGTGRNGSFWAERLEKERIAERKNKKKGDKADGLVSGAMKLVGVAGGKMGAGDDQAMAQQEAAAGNQIKSLTFVDKSAEMVEVAKQKWTAEKSRREAEAKKSIITAVPGLRNGIDDGVDVRWAVGDAEKVEDIPPAPRASSITNNINPSIPSDSNTSNQTGISTTLKSFIGYDSTTNSTGKSSPQLQQQQQTLGTYDTIIQTMGLCSTPDPVSLLKNLSLLCKKPTPTSPSAGKILLLEHGRSHYDWLNNMLDNLAPGHADRYGCWWNRDIGAIVQRAAVDAGLEIVRIKRWHAGSTWEVELRPATSNGQ